MAATYTHVLVLDFDGTVCLGDGPVFAYARLLDEAVRDTGGIVLATVERFLGETDARASTVPPAKTATNATTGHAPGTTGLTPSSTDHAPGPTDHAPSSTDHAPSPVSGTPGSTDHAPGPIGRAPASTEAAANGAPRLTSAEALALVAGSVDGYEAAERLGRALGATDAQLGAAYAGSREELASGAIETHAPDGLAALLLGLPGTTQVVLVTNAPENGVTQQLVQLGLADCFAELVTSAGKPAGMAQIVARLLAQNELSEHPQRLLSVGDIWRNDLAPATGLGCATALIERHPAPADARPTYRADDIRRLYPAIAAWAATG
ncbi:HAD family hydrolase [Subtercola endophyticus]|uniref:HAD family hydrolase n=1 Tax=Subtercola endophyticus TaxID=2895559 RepID=UPI001E345309|nr:HAD family hydrolase [Subtercola endophyticus]UFS58200.1 HAD family hydrolase [Subtercola endophyticus]